MRTLCVVGLVLFSGSAFGQNPNVQRAADELARISRLEDRVANLEAKLGVRTSVKQTYDEARALATTVADPGGDVFRYQAATATALANNIPLVIWSGTAICPPCVERTKAEFSNYVGGIDGQPKDSIAVYVPVNGELQLVGVVDSWIPDDAVYGHVPSIRQLIANWRSRRVTAMPFQQASFTYQQPMNANFASMSMTSGAGGCATCGQASRGFFGRR